MGPVRARSARAAWAAIIAVGALTTVVACSSASGRRAPAGTASPTTSSSVPAGGSSSVPAPTLRPVPSTPVPAATRGNLSSTVAPETVVTRPPVPLTATARFDGALTARIASATRSTVTGRLPGETSGAALRVQIVLGSTAAKALSTDAVQVTVTDAAGQPLVLVESASARVPATVAPGRTVSGRYVFRLVPGFTDPVKVDLSYSTRAPVLVFTGRV